MQHSCEMDTKVQIKEEQPLSDDFVSENDIEFFTSVTIKTDSNAVLPDAAFKTEIKSEIPFPDFGSQNVRECFAQHYLKQIKSQTITYSNNCEIDTKIEIASQEEGKFISTDPVNKVMKYNSDHEGNKKMEIKVEPCWLKTETPSDSNYVKDGDLTPVKPPRLCREASPCNSSGDSSSSAEVSGNKTSFSYGKYSECEIPEYEKLPHDEKHVDSEQPFTCPKERKISSRALVTYEGERSHKCNICEKSFSCLSSLKLHNLMHKGIKLHKCEICNKSFKWWSDLNRHMLTHEGKRPHKCEICDKSFNSAAYLKKHNLIHEGIKPYKCKICEKSFSQVSNLNSHALIHEGKKPHKCKYCEKSFTQSSNLKVHILIHEAKKPHKCEICEKSFTRSTSLQRHVVIHTGEKQHKCKFCDRSFNNIANLKAHVMIHEGIRPHKCEICEKSFTRRSFLNKHILIHERKKPQV